MLHSSRYPRNNNNRYSMYYLLQVKNQTTSIDSMLKSLICDKTKVPHMVRTVYDPSCLPYCKELCGVRCQNLCNKADGKCKSGNLPDQFLHCPSAASVMKNMQLAFVTFESKDVERFGKGKPYKRVEKIMTDYTFDKFKKLQSEEFHCYAEHTLSYWFLRATKLEAFAPSQARSTTASITSDFGEAIQIVGKRETSDQFYHRPEVRTIA